MVQVDGNAALGNIHVGPSTAQVQAYSLPLDRFPPGEYRLRITVTDRVAGEKVTQEVPFVVAP